MGFKENLKSELNYSGIRVKELAATSGIKKHTIDNYLNTHNSMPSAASAVQIARVLGCSVEYLITGNEPEKHKIMAFLSHKTRTIVNAIEALDESDQDIVMNLIDGLRKRKPNEAAQ